MTAIKNFTVYWNNEKTAYVDCKGDKVVIHRYTTHPAKQIFAKDVMTRYELGQVLLSRCWDEKRENLDKYLSKIGLTEFNPYAICEYTHGVMFGSKIWFLYDGENLKAEDVLLGA